MNVTTHLKLQQPTSDEKYNVANQNANMDILDSEVKKLQEADKNLLSKSTFNEHRSNQNNPHSVTKTQLGLGNVNNVRQLPVITDAVTPNGVPVFDGNGYKLKDSGFLLEASVPSNAKFTDTVYVHPKSDVLEGTYNSVFVNNDGHVLRGENPTTLSGYGITDGETKGSAATALIDAKKYTDVQVASVQSGSGLKKMIVAALPTSNIDQNTLYLVLSGNEASDNKYKEYLNLDGTSNGWEYVGNSNVDLADYYNKSEANRLFLLKDNITQSNVNDSGKVPSSALLYENHNSLQEKIDALTLMEKNLDAKIAEINGKVARTIFTTYKVFKINATLNDDVTIPLNISYQPIFLHIMANVNTYTLIQSTYFGNAAGNLTVTYQTGAVSGLAMTTRCVHLTDNNGNTFAADVKNLSKETLVLSMKNTSTLPYDAWLYITVY